MAGITIIPTPLVFYTKINNEENEDPYELSGFQISFQYNYHGELEAEVKTPPKRHFKQQRVYQKINLTDPTPLSTVYKIPLYF